MISILANPLRFIKFARIAAPLLGITALACIGIGIWLGIWKAQPPEHQGGHNVRIMFVHVPAAWNAMMAYGVMAGASLIAYIWRHPLADELARACALPGATFTALGLITGSLWGKISWGTYWQWDGRMTSVLILLFLFIGYMSIWNVIEDKRRAARIAGLVAMVGSVNLPIIKFSVDWWNSLHQSATVSSPDAPGLPTDMLLPLLLLAVGYSCFFGWVVINRVLYAIHVAKQARESERQPNTKISLETL